MEPTAQQSISSSISWPVFGWLEAVILLLVAGALLFYAYSLIQWHQRRQARLAADHRAMELEEGVRSAAIRAEDLATLRQMAPDPEDDDGYYAMLGDPAQLEERVAALLAQGWEERLAFMPALRQALGYQASNLMAPLVSTRQLQPQDPVRLAVWGGFIPRHHYAMVTQVGPFGFTVRLTPKGLEDPWEKKPEMDLYVLRSPDLETPFPCRQYAPPERPGELVLAHALREGALPARLCRVPFLKEASLTVYADVDKAFKASRGGKHQPKPQKGLLYDLSEQGFGFISHTPVTEGAYLMLEYPLREDRPPLKLLGRLLHCRPFLGNRHMLHCEARDLPHPHRQFLHTLLHQETLRRSENLATV